VHYGFGALDVHRDRLRLRLMRRRRGQDTLAFMRQIRLCYPRHIRLYWIQENLCANWTPDMRRQQHRDRPAADLRQLPQPHRGDLPADHRVRRQQHPTTSTGTPSRTHSPTPSATATAPTATAASPNASASS
jgi:hypothetical protein